MAELKIQAGASADVLNKSEMREVMRTVMQDWFQQVSRGDAYRRFSAQGTIAGGLLAIGGAEQPDTNLGPGEGFVWAVQRVGVQGLTTTTGDPLTTSSEPLALYVNDDGPSSLVHPAIEGYHHFGSYELVLMPGDTLLLTGASLTATGVVTVTGQAREVPLPLMWRLGG